MENIKTFEGFWDFLKGKPPVKKTLHSQELFGIKRKVKDFCDRLNIQNEFYFPEIGYGLNLEYTKLYTIQDIDFRFDVCYLKNTPVWSILRTFIPIATDGGFKVSNHIEKLELFKDFDIVRESEDGSYEFLCNRFILFIQEIGVKSFSEEYGVDDFKRSNVAKEISKHYKIV